MYFKIAHSLSKKFKMTKNVDFIIIDIHGEYAAEKNLLAIYMMARQP